MLNNNIFEVIEKGDNTYISMNGNEFRIIVDEFIPNLENYCDELNHFIENSDTNNVLLDTYNKLINDDKIFNVHYTVLTSVIKRRFLSNDVQNMIKRSIIEYANDDAESLIKAHSMTMKMILPIAMGYLDMRFTNEYDIALILDKITTTIFKYFNADNVISDFIKTSIDFAKDANFMKLKYSRKILDENCYEKEIISELINLKHDDTFLSFMINKSWKSIEKKLDKNITFGRPKVEIDEARFKEVYEYVKSGTITNVKAMDMLKLSKATYYRRLKELGL